MNLLRYRLDRGEKHWGILEGERVRALQGDPFGEWAPGEEAGLLAEVTLLAPVRPSKVICIGRNYAAHAAELGNEVPREPLIFLKPPSAVIGPGEAIRLPALSQRVEHEGELALVIGRRCRRLSEGEAMGAIYGYTCANDVTARDLQRSDGQWARAKGFDTFCPLGPWIVTAGRFDPSAIAVRCLVNGEVRQSGNTRELIFGLPRLLRDISAVFTLEPGDVILTGTPEGVGSLAAGDQVTVEIEGIGTLWNPVVGEE